MTAWLSKIAMIGVAWIVGGATSPMVGCNSSSADSTSSCPMSKPQAGATCNGELTCEYGSDPSVSCDTLITCSSGAWSTMQEPTDAGCSTTNSSTCPLTFDAITQGDSCGSLAFDCYYTEARCSCAVLSLDGCFKQPDCPAPTWNCDTPATETDATQTPAGFYLTPEQGCPVPRPRIGSSCTDAGAGMLCNYGYCQGGVALVCTSGVWQNDDANVPCPK